MHDLQTRFIFMLLLIFCVYIDLLFFRFFGTIFFKYNQTDILFRIACNLMWFLLLFYWEMDDLSKRSINYYIARESRV